VGLRQAAAPADGGINCFASTSKAAGAELPALKDLTAHRLHQKLPARWGLF
jgi:hypothetical protein